MNTSDRSTIKVDVNQKKKVLFLQSDRSYLVCVCVCVVVLFGCGRKMERNIIMNKFDETPR